MDTGTEKEVEHNPTGDKLVFSTLSVLALLALTGCLLLASALFLGEKGMTQPRITDIDLGSPSQAPNLGDRRTGSDWPPAEQGYAVEMNATDLKIFNYLQDTGGASNWALVKTFRQHDPSSPAEDAFDRGVIQPFELVYVVGQLGDVSRISVGGGTAYQSVIFNSIPNHSMVVFSLAKPEMGRTEEVSLIGYESDHTVGLTNGESAQILVTRALQTQEQYDRIARQVYPDWDQKP